MTVETGPNHPRSDQRLEAALESAQAGAEATGRVAASVARELKRARAAAGTGQVRDLRKALEAAESLTADLAEQLAKVRAAYDVDEVEHLASGAYTRELMAAAADAGLAMFEEDDRLLCYPSLIRVLAGDLAIEIDRRRERRLRPSVVVDLLNRTQQAGAKARPEPFIASLLAAYDYVIAAQGKTAGSVVRVVEVYSVLTLLPGQSKDYTKQEFARDLYLLDRSGVSTVGSPRRRLRWAASTGTK